MKVQITTISSEYDENTGVSKATILTDLGAFEGKARLHPEDAEIASRYAGCRYAEERATIKYAKMKIKVINNQLKVLKNIAYEIKHKKYYKENNSGIKVLEKNIYILEDEKEYFKKVVSSLTKKLLDDFENRPKIIKEREEKKQSNE